MSTRPQPSTPIARDRLIVALALSAAALLAWAWLLRSSTADGSMDAMAIPAAPFSAGYLLPAFVMWSIMMVAMMVPSAMPMILLYSRIDKAPTRGSRTAHSLVFALAYLLVWSGFSAAAALVQAGLVAAGLVSAASLSLGSRTLAAVLLAAAAAYELTVAKRLCLDKCHSPLLFVLKHFRSGAAGAFRLGLIHGLFCLGCCWALMLLLFAGGVMNLAWIAVLAIIVFGEKFAPRAWQPERSVATGLVLGAVALFAY